jgi:hypothetical protein
MSSQLLNGPRGLALVLTPPVRRRGAASVRRGMRPSGGSTTSQGRLFLRSKESKMRCVGGQTTGEFSAGDTRVELLVPLLTIVSSSPA